MSKIEIRNVADGIVEFLRSEILAENVHVSLETRLADIGIDSVSIIELVLFIERGFGVRVPDSELTPENLLTVQSLANCVLRQSAEITIAS